MRVTVLRKEQTLAELERLALPGAENLLRCTDVLIDGPYLPELPER